MNRKGNCGKLLFWCLFYFFFSFEAGNPITEGSFVGFNNFQKEIWAQGLLRLMRDKTQISEGHLGGL